MAGHLASREPAGGACIAARSRHGVRPVPGHPSSPPDGRDHPPRAVHASARPRHPPHEPHREQHRQREQERHAPQRARRPSAASSPRPTWNPPASRRIGAPRNTSCAAVASTTSSTTTAYARVWPTPSPRTRATSRPRLAEQREVCRGPSRRARAPPSTPARGTARPPGARARRRRCGTRAAGDGDHGHGEEDHPPIQAHAARTWTKTRACRGCA